LFKDVEVSIDPPGLLVMACDFFVELSDIFTRLVTFPDHVLITGDLNVRLGRVEDPSARQLYDSLATFGMVCHVTLPTHDMGGLLDVVITRADLQSLPVDVNEIALSDHRLLQWTVPCVRPVPANKSVTCRQWLGVAGDVLRPVSTTGLILKD
jgi:hypothetical protein